MVELEIDGTKVEVQEGAMVMEAAHKLGVTIPHFCYHKKLSIAANCRMCLVEVEKAPKPLPACATPVSAGMVVKTQSAKAKDAQQSVMEFLLINHPLDCPICDQGGECQLQDLAVGYGKGGSRYTEEKRVVFHKNVGPLISMEEMSRCIHCTRCVRFGQEIAGVMEFGMLGRGEHSEITTFVGKSVSSELSGNMIDICPVGALTSKPFRYAARTWELARRRSISPHDSLGSNLVVQVKGNQVMRVVPFENEAVNECWLSDRDRFSYQGLNSPQRLLAPKVKRDGQWHTVTWPEALEFVSARLQNIKAQHGAQQIQAYAHPMATFEELALLGRLMHGLDSDQIDTRLMRPVSAGSQWLGATLEEFTGLQNIFIIGSDLRADQPLLTARLRQMVKRGARLHLLNAFDATPRMTVAQHWLSAPSTWLDALQQVHDALATLKQSPALFGVTISAQATAIASALAQGKAGVFMGSIISLHPDLKALEQVTALIAKLIDANHGYLTETSIAAEIALPPAIPLADKAKAILLLHCEAEDFLPRAAFIERVKNADCVVALSAYEHASEYAHVMLPIAPFTETSGSFINLFGQVQSFNGVVSPLGETRPAWKVLRVLGNLLGIPKFDFETSEAVRDDLLKGQSDLVAHFSAHSANAAFTPDLHSVLNQTTGARLERVPSLGAYARDGITRRAPALQETLMGKNDSVFISASQAAQLGIKTGDSIALSHQQTRVVQTVTVLPDSALAAHTVHIPVTRHNAHLPLFGALSLEKV